MPTDRRRQQALAVIEEVLAAARELTPALQRLASLEQVGRALAALDPERAFALIAEAREQFRRDLRLDEPQPPDDPRAEANRVLSSLEAREGGGLWPREARQVLQTPDASRALARARLEAERCLEDRFALWADAAARAFPERAVEFYRRAEAADPQAPDTLAGWYMANTVRVFARTDPHRALGLARHISRRWNRVVALCEVAEALADRDAAAAAAIVDEALAEARSDDRPDYRAGLLRRVVRALRLVDHGAALTLARTIPDALQRARALVPVAGAFAQRRPEEAHAVLEEALRAVGEVTGQEPRYLQVELVEAWAQADPRAAVTVARRIRSPRLRVRALAALVPALAAREPAMAKRIGAEVLAKGAPAYDEHEPWRERILHVLVRLDAAVALEAATRSGDARSWLLPQVARQAALLDASSARMLADRLPRPEERDWALVGVAEALVEIDPLAASEVIAEISDDDARDHAHASAARVIAGSDPQAALQHLHALRGEPANAEGVAEALATSDPAAAVSLAWRLCEGGGEFSQWAALRILTKADPSEALRLTREVRDPPLRVHMMLYIADALLGVEGWSEEDFTEQESPR
jgi:hypothetical protein